MSEEEPDAATMTAEEVAIAELLGENVHKAVRTHQETALQVLTQDENAGRLTHFWNRDEPTLYALFFYHIESVKAVGEGEWKEPGWALLLLDDFRNRPSWKRGGRKDIVDTTHILERHGEGGRGGFFSRRRG